MTYYRLIISLFIASLGQGVFAADFPFDPSDSEEEGYFDPLYSDGEGEFPDSPPERDNYYGYKEVARELDLSEEAKSQVQVQVQVQVQAPTKNTAVRASSKRKNASSSLGKQPNPGELRAKEPPKNKRKPNTPWEAKFALLEAFKEEHGHVNGPYHHKTLGQWVSNQRTAYIKSKAGKAHGNGRFISKEKIKLLESIGFKWRVKVLLPWEVKFALLKTYGEEHGHVNVPYLNKTLGQWVTNQRRAYIKSKAGKARGNGHFISKKKIKLLESIGFKWSPPRGRKKKS